MKRSHTLLGFMLLVAATPGIAMGQTAPSLGADVIPTDSSPRVHIQTNRPGLRLYESRPSTGPWFNPITLGWSHEVCVAPCDRIIDARAPESSFYFAGTGVEPSPYFRLAGRGPDVHVDVDAGSAGKKLGGAMMAVLGGASVVGGVTLLVFAETDGFAADEKKALLTTGGVVLGVGVGLLISGIVLAVNNTTHYRFAGPQVGARSLSWAF
jgi:hypothetical protein